MFRLRQRFDGPSVTDVAGEVERQLAQLRLNERVNPGESVAITAGSRGIANIPTILKGTVDHFRRLGAVPFLVPAMGSHGGATAEGQLALLARYGITPESVGCEIRSSMETVTVGTTPYGFPVHFDRNAYSADHVFVVNRVKPHTRFAGDIESGLHKMLLIGLGKFAGAQLYHRAIVDHSFDEILRAVAGHVLKTCRVVGGLAVVENAYDETARIASVRPEEFATREAELLREARALLPRLPFRDCDLLIIDEIGKDVSGAGMDTNIVGRKFDDKKATDRDEANCKRIFVRGLTEATGGNATGIGIADFTNERTVAKIDRRATAVNCVTGSHPTAAAIPIAFPTDRECVEAALLTLGLVDPPDAKVIHITNTLHLAELWASERYVDEAAALPHVEVMSDPAPIRFDETDNLLSADR
ncbi:MAG: nickel-dependent lactate racemase [Planctomycetota bacterium]|nr:nickel-dependent lactate racemase [Planctomycetota bacterium]